MLRLQHEVIIVFRPQDPRDRLARHAIVEAVLDDGAEVGLPAAEVVVDVDRGNLRGARAPLQRGNPRRHRDGLPHERPGTVEVHGVDDVDEQQRGRRIVGNVAMQVSISGGAAVHRNAEVAIAMPIAAHVAVTKV